MISDDPALLDLARAIVTGAPVDWSNAEFSAGTEAHRELVRELKIIAGIAELYRSLPPAEIAEPTDGSASTAAATLAAPQVVDRAVMWGSLTLLAKVGQGSFGDVYHAHDTRLGRDVALKLLRAPQEIGDDIGTTIVREGHILARVRHPNVVTIYGADRIDGRVGLWMEFIHGPTLEQLLRDRGPFGPEEALLVGVDLCRALSAVHRAGVVHRDIKTQNVMREEGGRIVLMDFGTGRDPDRDGGGPTLSGTPLYLAPELFDGTDATVRSDIYALGVLLFHLVSRAYPIPGSSVSDVRLAHREGRRVLLRDVRPDVPERFIKAIERALARDAAARYDSAGDMERALLGALAPLDESTRGSEGAVSAPSRATWILAAAIATAVVVVAALTVGQRVLRPPRQPAPPSSAAAAGVVGEATSLTARRVSVPPGTFQGRPSADGRYLSYVDLNGDLCLQDLATGQSRRLTNKGESQEGAEYQMALSPDGKLIAYTWRTLDGTNEIRVIGEDGKWPRVLFRRADVEFPNPLQWSEDGTQILSMLEVRGGSKQLVLIAAATGAVRPVKTFTGGEYHPALSPDGRFVAFDQAQHDDARARDVFVMRVDGHESRPIVEHPANDLFPVWTADGRLLFVSDRTGTLGLWAVRVDDARATSEPELLVREIGRLAMPLGLTRDGGLYYYLQNGIVDVYTQAIDLTGRTPPKPPQPVCGDAKAPRRVVGQPGRSPAIRRRADALSPRCRPCCCRT